MTKIITESVAEDATLSWFKELGYSILYGPDLAPGELYSERADYADVVLKGRLEKAIAKINPQIPAPVREEALRKLLHLEHPSLVENNHSFHKFLINGVPVEFQSKDRTVYDYVWPIDFSNPDNNDWLAVNQFTVIENRHNRRPDIVIFVNGLPLVVIELKNPAKENATILDAFNQIQTYKAEIPSIFAYNEAVVISDGIGARTGTITSGEDRFMAWRTIEGDDLASKGMHQLEVLIQGIFEKRRFLELIRYFTVFEKSRQGIAKKMAGYHQFHAVQKAVECTVEAVKGDKRVGVIWHTQGSGKSLTMAFYAGKIIQNTSLKNPTLVLLTDRNDLDDQLFDNTFVPCQELLYQTPVQAETREKLRELLKVASGGVIFTTIQKFLPEEKGDKFPLLSDRRNIIVIADEAHRSQYDFIDGFARHMRDALPNASFIGFTATPIEKADRNTIAVFGDCIDVYDIYQSIEDKATVPIYYEARLAKLGLKEDERPKIDPDFEEVTEKEELTDKERLKRKWSQLEALVGAEKRINLVAKDIVEHFENRLSALEGKGLIVCMSRRICVELYDAIIKLRPKWHDPDDKKGVLKIVMTGSASDKVEWQQHIRDKKRRRELGDRFKDEKDPLKLVIVRDMWLTGFDVPCLHTMYIDKPMRGHGLMQAIARVNRVFKDKPGGLVVDYLGIAHELKKALSEYTDRDRGQAGLDQELAVAALLERFEQAKGMFFKFDYSAFMKGKPEERMRVIPAAIEHILKLEDGKNRYLQIVKELSMAFALAVPHEKALKIRDEVGFFQTIRAAMLKITGPEPGSSVDMEAAIRQIVSRAISSDEIIDIFSFLGVKKPDISILSDQFLAEMKDMPQKNLAIETLRKLLNDEIKIRKRKFLIQSRLFSDMLDETIQKYHNRAIDAVKVIEELIGLAKDMREAHRRGDKLGLSEEELAFYDALEVNDSAVKVLGDEILKTIARDLVESVRKNISIDWTVRESIRAKIRANIRRILRKHGYPPDKAEKATSTVLEQAELICKELAA